MKNKEIIEKKLIEEFKEYACPDCEIDRNGNILPYFADRGSSCMNWENHIKWLIEKALSLKDNSPQTKLRNMQSVVNSVVENRHKTADILKKYVDCSCGNRIFIVMEIEKAKQKERKDILKKIEGKFILDVACGGRMFWQNKNHPNAVYQDIRKDVLPLKEQYGINFSVEPDMIGDFRKMVFSDKSFKMVIFDPPHLMLNKTAWMAKKYGTLKGTDFKEDLRKGFEECWRVLNDFGTLVFKWNDCSIDIREIRPLFPAESIIFNKVGKKDNWNYWFVFMKIPEIKKIFQEELNEQNKKISSK